MNIFLSGLEEAETEKIKAAISQERVFGDVEFVTFEKLLDLVSSSTGSLNEGTFRGDSLGKDFVVIIGDLEGFSRGIEICRKIRSSQTSKKTPIILLTGRVNVIDEVVALEVGADDVIAKNVDYKILIARVRALWRRYSDGWKRAKSPTRSIANINMDRGSMRVTVSGKEMSLTHKEFELLWAMMGKIGEAVSRKDISRTVWGEKVYVENRTVDVHICLLRSKLSKHRSKLKIKTVRNLGYCLVLQ